MEWIAGEALLPKPGDGSYFQADVARYVQYRCPPLPLLSLSPCQHKHKFKILSNGNHLGVVSSHDGRPHLLCVGRCCTIYVYQCLERDSTSNKPRDRLHPHNNKPRPLGGDGPSPDASVTYEEWCSTYSEVSLVCLATYTLSRRETLRHLHVHLVKGLPHMCIATSSRLLLFELSGKLFTHHNSQACIAAAEKLDPLVDIPLKNISYCSLSPHEVGDMLVSTETGGIILFRKDYGTTEVLSGCDGDICVCYGSHTHHILVLWRNTLISINVSSSKVSQVPVQFDSCPVLLESQVYGQLSCMAMSPRQPFLLHLVTPTHFIVVDIRQPKEPLLYEPHLLDSEPRTLTVTATDDCELALICSNEANLVMRFCTSLPLSLIGRGHMVGIPNDALCCLKKSEVAGLLVGPVASRLRAYQQLGWGAALLTLQQSCATVALVLTGFGDVFFQSFEYSPSMNRVEPFSLLPSYLHGYKLWIAGEVQRLRKVRGHQPVETRYPATVRDLSSIAKSILGGVKPRARSHQVSVRNGHSSRTPGSTLQELCADLHVATPLDRTLLDMWDNYVPPLNLFPQTTSDASPDRYSSYIASNATSCNTAPVSMSHTDARATMSHTVAHASMNQYTQEDDKHSFQDSFLFESSYHDDICMTPKSSPCKNRFSAVTTPTSKSRRKVGF